MEHSDTYPQKEPRQTRIGKRPSPQETLVETLEKLNTCQKEIHALNKKLLSLCKSDKEQRWLKSRDSLHFHDH